MCNIEACEILKLSNEMNERFHHRSNIQVVKKRSYYMLKGEGECFLSFFVFISSYIHFYLLYIVLNEFISQTLLWWDTLTTNRIE